MCTQIEEAIGHTPFVEIRRLPIPEGVRIFAKLEFLNPSGSIKDRMVRHILDHAAATGVLCPGGTIVENTSGNTGAAIAMFAAARGYRAILTMPDKVSQEKQDALLALGAEIVVCPTAAAPHTPEHYVCTARRLSQEIPGAFMLNQYDNPLNVQAHFLTTGPEIWSALGKHITAFVASGSTGGTVSGVGRYLRAQNPDIQVVLLDPVGSIYFTYFHQGVIDHSEIASYHVEGVGEDHLAKCMDFTVITDVIRFDDQAAFAMCHALAAQEGLLCGGSAGANVWGCLQLAQRLQPPATIVTVLPDSGIKYISKIYNDHWLVTHGFSPRAVKSLPMPPAAA